MTTCDAAAPRPLPPPSLNAQLPRGTGSLNISSGLHLFSRPIVLGIRNVNMTTRPSDPLPFLVA